MNTKHALAYIAGRAAFAADLARRFDFDRQPRNPYRKSNPLHRAWWDGLNDAGVAWLLV